MPFTISHTAAVLPFSRYLARRRLLSAAVIGSMVPDFGYLLPLRLARFETHSALALLTFCLPVGLASYWLFQVFIKTPVLEILPDNAYSRSRFSAAPADFGSVKQWLLAAGGILAGAITHLVWDGFTHEGARGVRMIPELNAPLFDVAGHHLFGFKLLQQLSTLVGLAVVAWFAWRALRLPAAHSTQPRMLSTRERRAWFIAYVFAAVLAGVAVSLIGAYPRRHGITAEAGDVAIAGLRGMAISLIGVSLILRARLRARRRAAGR